MSHSFRKRSIIFRNPITKALFDGWKTQHRIVVQENEKVLPYGGPGDMVWVKEPCRRSGETVVYKVDYSDVEGEYKTATRMGLKESRMTLRIKHVRTEGLREMTDDDALTEGVRSIFDEAGERIGYGIPGFCRANTPRNAFWVYWNRITRDPKLKWDYNPLVWVMEFDVIHENICDLDRKEKSVKQGKRITPRRVDGVFECRECGLRFISSMAFKKHILRGMYVKKRCIPEAELGRYFFVRNKDGVYRVAG